MSFARFCTQCGEPFPRPRTACPKCGANGAEGHIDAASRDLLTYFVQSLSEEPLLLVLIAREREAALRPLIAAAASTGRFVDIALQPLHVHEAQRLGEELMADAIAARAEGDSWSVRRVVLTRFDSLEPPVGRALQKAAVLGRAFPIRLLRQIVGERVDVAKALEELRQRGFLVEEAFGPEKGYAFRHALIEEAIHSTLARRDRQALHRQAATAIEEGWWPSDRTEMLAHHWSESAEPQRAAPYLIAAAEHAARRHANETAVDHCRKVLNILSGGDERTLRVQLILGRALKFLGRLPEVDTTLRRASQALYARLGVEDASPSMVALYVEVLRELGDVKDRERALEEAFARLDEAHLALVSFGVAGDTRGLRESLLERMAWVRLRQGRLDEALRRADDLLREVESQPDAGATLLTSLYDILGGVLRQYGKLEAAASYTRKSVALHHQLGSRSAKRTRRPTSASSITPSGSGTRRRTASSAPTASAARSAAWSGAPRICRTWRCCARRWASTPRRAWRSRPACASPGSSATSSRPRTP